MHAEHVSQSLHAHHCPRQLGHHHCVQAEGVGAGVHLCMWGSMDPTQDSALDMTLGFPADTLTWAGLKGVPQDGMLTVAVRGTAEKPKIDWQGCVHSI
jgi:hypothetical protein